MFAKLLATPEPPDFSEIDRRTAAEREVRQRFLEHATPHEVLEWIMRHPDTDATLVAYCAKALLAHPKDDI